jgi:2-dehydro-3-deoxy-L-rhamnonate dehydrogenase (NAD+)
VYPELAGKRAIVTGAAAGIGAAVTRRLAAEGARVALLDITDAGALAAQLSPEGVAVACDVRSGEAVASAVATIVDAWGGVDIVVNNAGITGTVAELVDLPEDEFLRVLDIDLVGTYRVTRAALPYLLAGGWARVVNIASISGKDGNPRMTAYAAAKAGVIGFTKALGRELATTGVLVNAIAPGGVSDTNISVGAAAEMTAVSPVHPMGRLATPDEVAALVTWLCSDQVSFSTGAVYDISGGRASY